MTSFLYLNLQGKSVGKNSGCVVSEQETHRWSTGLAASTSFRYPANASAPPHNVALSAPCMFVCMHRYTLKFACACIHAYNKYIIYNIIRIYNIYIHVYVYVCLCVSAHTQTYMRVYI